MWPGSKPFWLALALSWAHWAHGGGNGSAPRPWRRLKPTLIALALIPLANGCAATTQIAPPPPRPTLESMQPTNDGGLTMNRQDAMELLLYIDQLERR